MTQIPDTSSLPHNGAVQGQSSASNNIPNDAQTEDILDDASHLEENIIATSDVSAGIYCMLWVKDEAPGATLTRERIDIVYCGGNDTQLYRKFYKHGGKNYLLKDLAGGMAGIPGCTGLRHYNDAFGEMFLYLKPMFDAQRTLCITIHTTLKVTSETTVNTYRADPLSYLEMKPRHDWALFNWGKQHGNVPCQIRAFFILDVSQIKLFNNTISAKSMSAEGILIAELEKPGIYTLIHSARKQIPGLMDPTKLNLDTKESTMQTNTVLFSTKKRR